MHILILNISLLLAWVLITVGGILLNVGAGLLISGITLIALSVYMATKFGVYAPSNAKGDA